MLKNKKFLSIFFVILIVTLLAGLLYIFLNPGYSHVKEPPDLVIYKDDDASYKGLTLPTNWNGAQSSYPVAEELIYSKESTIVINKNEEVLFHIKNLSGKIEDIRLIREPFNQSVDFKKNSFTISPKAAGTYYLQIRVSYPQKPIYPIRNMVTYSFKLVVEFGEIVVEPSKTPSLTALFGKIKLPEKEYASSMLSYEYMVYSYGLDRVYINIGTGLTPLSTALRDNLITMEDITNKCDRDVEKGIIPNIMYKDGGSKIYKYDDYTIVKYDTVEGYKDIYIGTPEIDIDISKKKNHMIN